MNILLMVKDYASGKKVSKDGIPMKSGGEFHAEMHALELKKLGHNVTIMAKKKFMFTKSREILNGIDLVRLHAPFRWLEIIIRMLTTHKHVDSVYIIGNPKFSVWSILMAKILNIPVTLALTINDEIFDSRNNWRNKLFAYCDNFIAMSNEIRNGFIESGCIASDKISVLPQGVNTKRFSKVSNIEKENLKKKCGFTNDDCIVMFCGRIVLRKGVDTIIKLWPLVSKKCNNAKLLIVGGGQKDLVDNLVEMGYKCNNTVKYIGEVDDPKEYYQMSDIFLFPSRGEGLPNTLEEAISCGLVPVVSNIGGCEDLVHDGENGFLVEKEDYQMFADKILALINNGGLRERFSSKGVEFIFKYCDYSNVIWKLENILKPKQ